MSRRVAIVLTIVQLPRSLIWPRRSSRGHSRAVSGILSGSRGRLGVQWPLIILAVIFLILVRVAVIQLMLWSLSCRLSCRRVRLMSWGSSRAVHGRSRREVRNHDWRATDAVWGQPWPRNATGRMNVLSLSCGLVRRMRFGYASSIPLVVVRSAHRDVWSREAAVAAHEQWIFTMPICRSGWRVRSVGCCRPSSLGLDVSWSPSSLQWMLRTALAQLQARCRVLPCGWRCAMDGGRLLRLVHAVAQGKFVTGPAEWARRAVRAWLSVVQTSVGVAE